MVRLTVFINPLHTEFMANLKEIRTRISSVKSTQQITSAMKMVSASRLRKAQKAIVDMRPYYEKLHDMLNHLTNSVDEINDNKYLRESSKDKVLIVLIASNRGLCGAFNSNVVKKTLELCKSPELLDCYNKNNIDFMTIGKKACDLLSSKEIKVCSTFDELYDELSYENVAEVADSIIELFLDKTYDEIYIVYNEFKNASVQNLVAEQFLPLKANEDTKQTENSDYIVEPDTVSVIQQMMPYALKTHFYKAILESYASEHGARMTAMHKATDNAADLLRELKLNYNKARQAAITNEILEIVSGADALKNA